VLTDGGREALEPVARKPTTSRALVERARIVPARAVDRGTTPRTAAVARTGVSRETARK
jgi:hypothetical protein